VISRRRRGNAGGEVFRGRGWQTSESGKIAEYGNIGSRKKTELVINETASVCYKTVSMHNDASIAENELIAENSRLKENN
jgi:hypothetical protein